MARLALWHDIIRYIDQTEENEVPDKNELQAKIERATANHVGAHEEDLPEWYSPAVDALEKFGWDDVDKDFIEDDIDFLGVMNILTEVLPEKKKFVGIKFCQECNNMLYPDDASRRLEYRCKNCGYFEYAADPCIYINRMVQDIDTLALISSDMATDPTLFHSRGNFEPCPQCGSDDSVNFQTLANREKSGMRLYFVCSRADCGHKWYSQNYGNKDEQPEEVVA